MEKIEKNIKKYTHEVNQCIKTEVYCNSESIAIIRDDIIEIGRIVEEDLENNWYIFTIKEGLGNAVCGIQIVNGKAVVIVYAKDNIFSRNNAGKAVETIKRQLNSSNLDLIGDYFNIRKKRISSAKKKLVRLTLLLVFIAIIVASIIGASKVLDNPNVLKYNEIATEYNTVAEAYNELATISETANLDLLPDVVDKKTVFSNVFNVLLNLKTAIYLDNDEIANELENLCYNYIVLSQLTNPSEDWIIERIQALEDIVLCQAVTPENDPNGLLLTEGGYTSCVYFSVKNIDISSVPGYSVVEKGTDIGGAIEVYKDKESASARIEYLAGFDGTLLYTGSYALIGTIVVRTSYQLTDVEQLELTEKIVKALTIVD